ncbi:hypothetical protein A9179_07620 [Pseudomonas alcaligenes]|uniref:ABC transporter ATP-binding protein n=2 Tax=Aquipseudomonas alcaligenes TaxID=43263 RepID=A0ABR7RZJ5_AQUAC|nr:hypothetical protein [Pseudomonas alcaligenes]
MLMLLLALARAIVDAVSAMLFAVVLAMLLGVGMGAPAWLGGLWVQLLALPVEALLAWLIVVLMLCKAVLAPFLGRLRGRLIDRWSVALAMRALAAELTPAASGGRQTHAQGRNITVNFTVSRVIMGGVFPSLDLLTELLVVAVLLAYLSWHLPLMGAGMLLGLALVGGAVGLLRRRFGRRDLNFHLRLQEQMHRWVTDSSHCLRELQLYGRVSAVLERYSPLARTFAESTSRERLQQDAQAPVVELGVLLMLAGAVFVLHQLAPQTDLTSVALCTAIGLRLLPALRRVFAATQLVAQVQGSIFELHALLDRADCLAAQRSAPRVTPMQAPRLMLCETLGYRYPGALEAVLRDVSTHLERGEWLGLVGMSGAGKSTLVDLLIGQLQPTSGTLVWAGSPVIGYAGASSTLLPGTLRDNIGLFGQHYTDVELGQALAIAGLAGWLVKRPQGLDTPVGEFEQHLSGGERQRLGLARAFLHAQDLLILDEATAALDELIEGAFLSALKVAKPHLAVLLITHRLSALRHAHRAVLLVDGRLESYCGQALSSTETVQ